MLRGATADAGGRARARITVTDARRSDAFAHPRAVLLDAVRRRLPMPTGRVAVLVWTYAIVAAVLLVGVTVAVPVSPRIALPFALADADPVALGVIVWILVGLATSSRGTADEGRAAIVFGVAPIVAVIALGGPTAAAWVALLGSFELREVRGDVPWYGVMANHAMLVVPAVAGGMVTLALRDLRPSDDGQLVDLVAVLAGAAVYCVGNMAMALATVWARTGRGPLDALGIRPESVVAMMVAESVLGWLFAATYTAIAWWSPVLLVIADVAASRSIDSGRANWLLRHHQLTELPNRLSFDEHAQDMRRLHRRGACVFYIDLDGFKAVNDSYDHDVGDDVLKVVGRRLSAAKRHDDFLAHLHGDEFVMLASGVESDAEAQAIVERIIEAVEPPIEVPSGTIAISASVGFGLVPDLGQLDAALRAADREMSLAKRTRAAASGRVRRAV